MRIPPLLLTTGLLFAHASFAGTVTVNGEGALTYTPDSVRLQLAAEAQDTTVATTQAQVSARLQAWESAVGRLRSQLQRYNTAQIQIHHQPVYDERGQPTGAQRVWARQHISFELSPLDALNDVLGAVQQAGLTYQLDDHHFFHSKAPALREQALGLAIDDARAQCEFIARRLDQRCGKVESLEVSDFGPRPVPMMAMAEAKGAGPVSAIGDRDLRMQVRVVFKLDDR